eukprot:730785-Hanusia_phi.AAC.3
MARTSAWESSLEMLAMLLAIISIAICDQHNRSQGRRRRGGKGRVEEWRSKDGMRVAMIMQAPQSSYPAVLLESGLYEEEECKGGGEARYEIHPGDAAMVGMREEKDTGGVRVEEEEE